MSAEKAQALVLQARPFGETSAIITLLTREIGKVRGLAKGAWRPKSKFDAALDLLSICQVLVIHRSSGNLDLFTEAFLEHRFRIGRYESSFAAGLYIADLLDSVTVDADPQPELFDLATRAIRFLSAPRPGQRTEQRFAPDSRLVSALIIHTELGILHQLGQLPSLYCCAECQRPLEGRRISFSMLGGGGLCQRCRRGKRSVVSVSSEAIVSLRQLADSFDQNEYTLQPEPPFGEIRAIMNTLFANILGYRLKTSHWLAKTFPSSREKHR
ncbi:MAG TPA: DNA repair protein RecO [Planctomycetaceae bacterium]|nr:DNA repair protein RecO [Planctomycetaceae bacterium]